MLVLFYSTSLSIPVDSTPESVSSFQLNLFYKCANSLPLSFCNFAFIGFPLFTIIVGQLLLCALLFFQFYICKQRSVFFLTVNKQDGRNTCAKKFRIISFHTAELICWQNVLSACFTLLFTSWLVSPLLDTKS